MQIWVDADACPKVVKDILFKAAQRVKMDVILVANQPLKIIPSPYVKSIQVSAGFDVADNYIVQQVVSGDLVITADIPLAAEVIAKNAVVIGPRGEELTEENIQQRLTIRNFMEEVRSSGQITGGPPPLSSGDKQAFANALDRWLSKKN